MIATLLIISIGTSMILVPFASAADPHNPSQDIITTAHVAALPELVGVGQHITIYAWLDKIFDGAQPSGSATANTYRFHNYKITITKPDNTTETLQQDYIADTTSNQAFSYTPSQTGVYTIKFDFPGQRVDAYDYSSTSALRNDTYLASSAVTILTVTEEAQPLPIDTYPLPSEYWARPIYGENSIWYLISSNWLGTSAPGYGGFANTYNTGGNGMFFPTDAVGPLTGHIMWTKPLQSGGVVGGDNFDIKGNTYFEGSAYIQRYMNPIIVNGRIYYNEPLGYSRGSGYQETCVDLLTGEKIWSRSDMPQPSFAYIYDVEDYNQHGVSNAILFTNNFARAFDAYTGEPLFNVTGVPSANAWSKVMGPSGEELRYVFTNKGTGSNPNWTLGEWNSSKLWLYSGNTPAIDTTTTTTYSLVNTTYYVDNVKAVRSDNVSSVVTAVDASISSGSHTRYDWTTPVDWRNTMSTPTVLYTIYGDMMLCMNGSFPSNAPSMFMGTYGFNPYTYFAVNLNASKGAIGNILWMKTYDPPEGNKTVLFAGVDPINRVFVENHREDVNFVGYNLDTGAKMWGPTTPQAPMDYYGSPASGSISNTFAYGRMYSSAYAGIVYCYDTKTGNVIWTYGNGGAGNSTQGGLDVPGHYPTFIAGFGNQGVIYTTTTEHTIETPLYKGALSRALNATTGAEIWTLNGYVGEFMGMSYAIADGYATWFNGLDNQIYSVGRGPSTMTVSAPLAAIQQCSSLVISGTVMDVSAGTQQNEQSARFANGVPVASDASMCDWMGYVYQQKPLPANFTGVNVAISVVDPNGNARYIGTTTTDAKGQFSYQWTPDITGKYTVIASFAGTNGYWPSSAEASFAVDPAAATPTPAPSPPQSMADLYFIPAIAGLLIAIIAVGLLTILVLRKRP
jgi:hypothetical protein